MRTLWGEIKMKPKLAPSFTSNLSKYIIQYSSLMASGGIWVLVHSAIKLASTWDLMAVQGAFEIP
jgi:hypothetical protein